MRHDELNVLGLETAVVDFLVIVILFLCLLLLNGLAFAILVGVVVAGMISVRGFSGCELLSCGSLRLRVEVFDLGFSEDAGPNVS